MTSDNYFDDYNIYISIIKKHADYLNNDDFHNYKVSSIAKWFGACVTCYWTQQSGQTSWGMNL